MDTPSLARLLIVDDEAAQRAALCDILGTEGYVTRSFASGREALAALRSESFDALLTDLMMPEIDGITLLRARREKDPDLACMVMTGHATVATAVEALKAGADDYVMKPFNVTQILAVLTRALDLRRLRVENGQICSRNASRSVPGSSSRRTTTSSPSPTPSPTTCASRFSAVERVLRALSLGLRRRLAAGWSAAARPDLVGHRCA